MNTSNKNKLNAKVFKTAWQIFKGGFAVNFKTALKKAWTIIKLSLGTPTVIEFAKDETGELRVAHASITGSLETISQGYVRFVESIDGKSKWRSFRISNLLTA